MPTNDGKNFNPANFAKLNFAAENVDTIHPPRPEMPPMTRPPRPRNISWQSRDFHETSNYKYNYKETS